MDNLFIYINIHLQICHVKPKIADFILTVDNEENQDVSVRSTALHVMENTHYQAPC